jgi:hypothetical protein
VAPGVVKVRVCKHDGSGFANSGAGSRDKGDLSNQFHCRYSPHAQAFQRRNPESVVAGAFF